jgi:uncharacterized protein (DUF58 family)
VSKTQEPLIDRSMLEKLERLSIQWHKSFAGLVGGHNRSRYSGPGIEFMDHRHFHDGDDLRAVNWRAYLRLEKLFLKLFQIEPRVPVRMLLDASPSMQTGTPSKLLYAKRLCAALCYIGLVRLDTISIQPFADRLYDSFVASGGRHRAMPAIRFLTEVPAGGATNLFQVTREFVSAYPQRGLLIVLSDFLDDADPVKPLQYLADFGHELVLVQLWAEEDRRPPWEGELQLEDAETGGILELSFDRDARDRYTDAFDAYSRELERVAQRNGGRYIGIPVTTTLEDAIFGPILRGRTVQ